MYLTHLQCPRCHADHAADRPQRLCHCGSPLLARYDLAAVAAAVRREEVASRPADLWRYRELLPVGDPAHIVSFGEGWTPLVPAPRYGGHIGVPRLLVKDEGLMATGSFKARGAAVGVSRARELGIDHIAMPTNGNAGAAWAAYAARAGIRATIAIPAGAPAVTRQECLIAGADVRVVDGFISDAGALIRDLCQATGAFNVATLTEPYRVEGKKTMGYEVVEQLGWRVPDVIVYPTGGGVGLIGIHKALAELRELGWIGPKLPRLVAVQSAGCAPIVRAYQAGAAAAEPWSDPTPSVAFGITVPAPLGDELVLRALAETDGIALAVTDEELVTDLREFAAREGLLLCPEGAAALTATRKLRQRGWLAAEDEVVVLNTGSGLKYPIPTRDSLAR